ncbi:hypothetical protein [Paenibacillus radicis (ex Xue et al. 2023)]|uniref:Uncharacterized protein n=1 Tax=Paenibacillus radicis (ex Xue et al. 2023) TaxID=2972489 RepID=A0ABT1YC07_9BACL|nr:hypothetical protein [Paenibacillus radicis (ex Xue et al. 2023)]MCR8630711.1 hypothetical protein [Paenibacillus radicis (ex Xue et al. 2023)]
MGGNRFWEFYLVRYLLGTIFGIMILFFLVINYNDQITASFLNSGDSIIEKFKADDKPTVKQMLEKDNQLDVVRMLNDEDKIRANLFSLLFNITYDVKKDDVNVILRTLGKDNFFPLNDGRTIVLKQTGFPVLAAIILAVSGFLYMYFSSMLILILHGVRKVLFDYMNKLSESKLFTLKKQDRLKTIALILAFLVLLFCFNWRHVISITFIIVFCIGFMMKYTSIHQFYEDLSSIRAMTKYKEDSSLINIEMMEIKQASYLKTSYLQPKLFKGDLANNNEKTQDENREYIESYRHLREHGNAFGIIVCEIVFAYWLIIWDFSYWAIVYWCLLGSTSWILGTYLEIARVPFKRKIKSAISLK